VTGSTRCNPRRRQNSFGRCAWAVTVSIWLLGQAGFGPAREHAFAQADVVDQLLAQARAWQAKGRMDKAIEAFQKVLLSQPEHPEALEAVGLFYANTGQTKQARELLASLQRVAAGSPGAARLRAALDIGKDFDLVIQQARAAVHAGRLSQAVPLYEHAFGAAAPPDRFALEYYQTLGGTEAGWEQARTGLTSFVRQHPDRVDAKLALAQHLSYREFSRREGIEQLRALAKQPATAKEAASAWRRALLWLRAGPGDAGRVRAYLDEIGPDEELSARLVGLSSHSASTQRGSTLQAGFEALERADVNEASRQFERAGDVPDALVGLALVAMRKEDFELAVKLLEKASQRAPTRQDLWDKPLRSARFWERVRRAEKLAASQNSEQAESLLLEAIELSPPEAQHARVALATLLQKAGRLDAAEQQLSQALAADPEQPLVERALIDLRLARGNYDAALEANTRLLVRAKDQAWPPAELEAEVLRRRAADRRHAAELNQARKLLEEALARAPKSFWVLHDLVSLELELGELGSARAGMEKLLLVAANEPATRVLRARLEAEQGRPELALEVLSTLPADAADGQVGKLRKELELRRDVDRVVRGSLHKGPFAARRELSKLQRVAADDPNLVAIVALGFTDVGEPGRAIELVQEALAAQSSPDSGLLLQLAAIYLRAGMDDELRQLLEELATDPSLTPRARHDLARLHVAFAVSSADKLARAGEYKRALAQLEPLLSEYQNDPALLSGLGRLFLQAGDNAEAAATFEQVLRRYPDHLEAREGAVNAAQAKHDLTHAQELVTQGLARTPNHARMHLIAARCELAKNDDAAAMRELEAARALAVKSDAGMGLRPHSQLVPSDSLGLLSRARTQLDAGGEALPAGEGKALIDSIDSEVERIRARHSVQVGGAPELRYRAGEPGLGRLLELRAPLWLDIPLGYFGHVEVGADAVYLSAGQARLDQVDLAERFGALGSVRGVTVRRMQDDSGLAPHAAFQYRDLLRLEVGTTPLGFLYRSLLGSLDVHAQWGLFTLRLHGERAAVKDSLLSYAGTTDPLTGMTWGGVTEQGGGIELGLGDHDGYAYLSGGFYFVEGRGVRDNRAARGSAGFSWLLYDWDGHEVSIGVSALGMAYANNSSNFTFGQGGYFSPELFVRGGVPLRWSFAGARLHSKLELDPGLNWFRREQAAYYPSSPDLQSKLVALGGKTVYPADQNFGFSLNLLADLRYELSAHVELGVQGSMHFATDYEEYRARVFLELNFSRRVRAGGGTP
jgi:tetratricopeptide (TPR) repeat protein